MIPVEFVHEFNVTKLLAWQAEQVKTAAAEKKARYEPDAFRVLGSLSEMFPGHKKAQTMQEWLSHEVKQVVKTRGALPTEPTPGVRIWQDASGSIRFNPEMVHPAYNPSPLEGQEFPRERGDKASVRITNANAAWFKALGKARRSAWTPSWWLEQQAA
jgi:hypothetical protein